MVREVESLANIKSSKKRALTNEKCRLQNKMIKTNLKSVEKEFLRVVAAGDAEAAKEEYKTAAKKFDMAASKGIIHKNAADRKKSQLAKKVDQLA